MFRTPYLLTSRSISCDDALWIPETVRIHGVLQPQLLLAGLERRLDAAERALVRAPERGVDGGVRLALRLTEAVPVVGPVLRPSAAGPTPRPACRSRDPSRAAPPRSNGAGATRRPASTSSPRILSSDRVTLPIRLEQVDDRVQAFVVRDEVTRFFGERALGKGSDMSAKHEDSCVGNTLANRRARQARPGHVLRGRGRLMAVHDDRHEPRLHRFDALGDLRRGELVGLGIDDLDASSHAAGRRWRSARPRLDSRQRSVSCRATGR